MRKVICTIFLFFTVQSLFSEEVSFLHQGSIPPCPFREAEALACSLQAYLRDSNLKVLRMNLREALEYNFILKRSTNYLSQNSTLANFELDVTSILFYADSKYAALFPKTVSRYIWRTQHKMVKLYWSVRRRLRQMNPVPGYVYIFRSRSPAFPFIFMESVDQLAYDLGTYPFTDDGAFKYIKIRDRSFGFMVSTSLY